MRALTSAFLLIAACAPETHPVTGTPGNLFLLAEFELSGSPTRVELHRLGDVPIQVTLESDRAVAFEITAADLVLPSGDSPDAKTLQSLEAGILTRLPAGACSTCLAPNAEPIVLHPGSMCSPPKNARTVLVPSSAPASSEIFELIRQSVGIGVRGSCACQDEVVPSRRMQVCLPDGVGSIVPHVFRSTVKGDVFGFGETHAIFAAAAGAPISKPRPESLITRDAIVLDSEPPRAIVLSAGPYDTILESFDASLNAEKLLETDDSRELTLLADGPDTFFVGGAQQGGFTWVPSISRCTLRDGRLDCAPERVDESCLKTNTDVFAASVDTFLSFRTKQFIAVTRGGDVLLRPPQATEWICVPGLEAIAGREVSQAGVLGDSLFVCGVEGADPNRTDFIEELLIPEPVQTNSAWHVGEPTLRRIPNLPGERFLECNSFVPDPERGNVGAFFTVKDGIRIVEVSPGGPAIEANRDFWNSFPGSFRLGVQEHAGNYVALHSDGAVARRAKGDSGWSRVGDFPLYPPTRAVARVGRDLWMVRGSERVVVVDPDSAESCDDLEIRRENVGAPEIFHSALSAVSDSSVLLVSRTPSGSQFSSLDGSGAILPVEIPQSETEAVRTLRFVSDARFAVVTESGRAGFLGLNSGWDLRSPDVGIRSLDVSHGVTYFGGNDVLARVTPGSTHFDALTLSQADSEDYSMVERRRKGSVTGLRAVCPNRVDFLTNEDTASSGPFHTRHMGFWTYSPDCPGARGGVPEVCGVAVGSTAGRQVSEAEDLFAMGSTSEGPIYFGSGNLNRPSAWIFRPGEPRSTAPFFVEGIGLTDHSALLVGDRGRFAVVLH